jgi:hypothetical protein
MSLGPMQQKAAHVLSAYLFNRTGQPLIIKRKPAATAVIAFTNAFKSNMSEYGYCARNSHAPCSNACSFA